MLGRSRHGKQIAAVIVVALALQTLNALADNKLSLKKSSDNVITVELLNTDPIAGFQFSINARGGIRLQSYEGTERSDAAGLGIYQYLKNDSTLNVVILAPYRASLPAGENAIGRISFTLSTMSAADTVRVFLTGVVICDANAQKLDVSAKELVWNLHQSNEARTATFTLGQNYPNPFNPATRISYQLNKPAQVRLAIYDITGREISRLVNEYQIEGSYSVTWNSTEQRGYQLSSGTYFARLQVGENVVTRKMLLTK
jgi:hypothetical protein